MINQTTYRTVQQDLADLIDLKFTYPDGDKYLAGLLKHLFLSDATPFLAIQRIVQKRSQFATPKEIESALYGELRNANYGIYFPNAAQSPGSGHSLASLKAHVSRMADVLFDYFLRLESGEQRS